MDRHLAKDWVVFLQLNPVRSVFTIFRRHVTRRARSARRFMFGALENNLYAVAFLRHGFKNWEGKDSEFRGSAQRPFSHL